MDERRCRFCLRLFAPSRFHPQQIACSDKRCQQQRHSQHRKQTLALDAEYRQVCRDSARKWRANHPDYWKRYRAAQPDSVEGNRIHQRHRDLRRRFTHLANNPVAPGLKSALATVWWSAAGADDLANNTVAPTQVFIMQGPM